MDRWRLGLAACVSVQAAAATAGAAYLLVGLVDGAAVDRAGAAWEFVCALGLAILLWSTVRAVARGRRWARGPLLAWQLIALPVSATMASSRLWPLGVVLLVSVVGGLVATGRPATLGGPSATEA
ncbi:MAG: hypothetical protein U0Q15_17700 [Kineosporiaceae bacterium]